MDADKCFAFTLRNDDKLKEGSFFHVQFAMLYTNVFGERRIRVLNHQMVVAKNLNAYYKGADCEALSHFVIKKELSTLITKGCKGTRESMINNTVTQLLTYR
jgi:protein transport protein SEC24